MRGELGDTTECCREVLGVHGDTDDNRSPRDGEGAICEGLLEKEEW